VAVSIGTGRTAQERQAEARGRGQIKPLGTSVIVDDKELIHDIRSTADPHLFTFEDGSKGVWKKDQPANRADAEVLVYELDNLFGFGVVPETVILPYDRRDGSCQRFIEDAKTGLDYSYKSDENWLDGIRSNRDRAEATMVLDYISGNKDRHQGNQIFDSDGKLWAVDNGQAQDWEVRGGGYFAIDFARAFPDSAPNGYKRIKLSAGILEKVRKVDSLQFSKLLGGTNYDKHFRLAWNKIKYIQETGELKW